MRPRNVRFMVSNFKRATAQRWHFQYVLPLFATILGLDLADERGELAAHLVGGQGRHGSGIAGRVERHALAGGDAHALKLVLIGLDKVRHAPTLTGQQEGDAESGVVLMKMELGLDTGPMIRTVRTPITQEDTSDTLMMRLAELGAELLVESLRTPDELDWTPQPEEGVTYAEKLLKTEAVIDWTLPAKVLANKVRAFNPFPGTVFDKDGVPVKIWQAEALELSGRPGEVLDTTNGLVIACGEGALRATVLQKPGKPKMAFGPFLQSLPFTVGEVVK